MINSYEVWDKVTKESESIADSEDVIVESEVHDVEQAILSVIQYN